MPNRMVGGMTQQYYHTIPPDIDFIKVSPTRDAIFQYLAQVPYDEFPQFISDILVLVEGHKLVDITDGPGDEKQDILTETPDGKRCLIQCKHKDKIEGKYSGDELDRVVAACMRKKCTAAIFVTNGDLSPQAKGYVNDNEYERLWPDKSNMLYIDYWNGARIYDKIKNNQDILNKWFSGMGQAHQLRAFKFLVSFHILPLVKENIADDFANILAQVIASGSAKTTTKPNEYEAALPGDITIKFRRWFVHPSTMQIELNPPEQYPMLWNYAVHALQIEAIVPDLLDKFSPGLVKESIIKYLFDNPSLVTAENSWLHILASPSESFIYLHDIGEPRQIELDSAQSYISLTTGIFPERQYCDLASEDFAIKPNDDGEEAIWVQKNTGIQVIQLFEQIMNPAEVFYHQQLELARLDEIRQFPFRAVRNVDSSEMMRVRRIVGPYWPAFTLNEDTFVWAYPPNATESQIELAEGKMKALGLSVLLVDEDHREIFLDDLSKDMATVKFKITSDLSSVAVPINLTERGFWISQDLKLKKRLHWDGAMELVKFKWSYENEHGFDHMAGRERLETHTSELPNLLFDLFTMRCDHMIDIGIENNPISINMRIYPKSLLPSIELAKDCIKEFNTQFDEIRAILQRLEYL